MKNILVILFLCLCTQSFFGQQPDFLEHNIYNIEINNPNSIRSVDLNNDGFMDQIILSVPQSKIFWLKNDGFQNYSTITLIDHCVTNTDFELKDMDNDGDLDILLICFNNIYLLENDGFENFTSSILLSEFNFSVLYPEVIEIVDLDLDGDLDIITHNFNHFIKWDNDGSNNFTKNIIQYLFPRYFDYKVIDFDDDGDLDIVGLKPVGSSGYSNSTLVWYRNDGFGVFTDIQTDLPEVKSGDPTIFIDDIDNDGDNDYLAASKYTDSIYLYKNDGNENFTKKGLAISLDNRVNKTYMSDFDNDGDKDILVIGVNIEFLINDGLENFSILNVYSSLPSDIESTLEDLDNDGDLDISLLSRREDHIMWLENTVSLVFVKHDIIKPVIKGGYKLVAIDLDQDSDIDIVGASNTVGGLFWFENDGYEQFTYSNINDTIIIPIGLSVSDIDSDGDLDILTGSNWNKEILWLENDGLQNFSAHAIEDSIQIKCLNTADLNNDGFMDLICGGYSGLFNTYINDGNENFTTFSMWDTNLVMGNILPVDIDQDGDIDLFPSANDKSKVNWFENDGTGNFEPKTINSSHTDDGILNCCVVDLDNDLDYDLITSITGDIRWYENDSLSNFSENSTSISSNHQTLQPRDINNDGYMDILTNKAWFEADSLYNFTYRSIFPFEMSDASALDIDEDGDLDVVSIASSGDVLNWYENLTYSNYIKITSIPFVDQNSNGVFDSVDNFLQNSTIEVFPEYIYLLPSNDIATVLLDTLGVYQFALHYDTAIWEATTPSELQVNVISENYYDTMYFGVKPKLDLLIETDLTMGRPRCNTNTQHNITLSNFGSNIDTGYVEFTLDSNADFISSNPSPDSIDDQTLYFRYGEILSGQSRSLNLIVKMPALIQTIQHELSTFVDTGLITLANNSEYEELILCSYDPNDKQVFPNYGDEGFILNDREELEYFIRFQNTGNDTAYTVELIDSLDIRLDPSSIRLISTSHTITSLSIDTNRALSFLFEEIYLPDSTTSQENSHGFVKFGIKQNGNIPLNTIITNNANVYFDENLPIVTNSTLNTIYDCNTLGSSIDLSLSFPFIIVNIDEQYVDKISWVWNDDTIHIGKNGFSLVPDTIGNIDLSVHLENALCTFDTTYTIYVNNIGMIEESGESRLTVFPNPTIGKVFVDLGELNNVFEVNVSTMSGKSIFQKEYFSSRLVSFDLPENSGIYLIKITKENGESEFSKVVVN